MPRELSSPFYKVRSARHQNTLSIPDPFRFFLLDESASSEGPSPIGELGYGEVGDGDSGAVDVGDGTVCGCSVVRGTPCFSSRPSLLPPYVSVEGFEIGGVLLEGIDVGTCVGVVARVGVGVGAVAASTSSRLCFNDKRGEVGMSEERDMSRGTDVSSSKSPGRLRRHKLRFSSCRKFVFE
jgi:hypothetical protein